jgi:hypothetical protein
MDTQRKSSPSTSAITLLTRYKPVYDDKFAELLAQLDRIEFTKKS